MATSRVTLLMIPRFKRVLVGLDTGQLLGTQLLRRIVTRTHSEHFRSFRLLTPTPSAVCHYGGAIGPYEHISPFSSKEKVRPDDQMVTLVTVDWDGVVECMSVEEL